MKVTRLTLGPLFTHEVRRKSTEGLICPIGVLLDMWPYFNQKALAMNDNFYPIKVGYVFLGLRRLRSLLGVS